MYNSVRQKLFWVLILSLIVISIAAFSQWSGVQRTITDKYGGYFAKSHILWQKERLKAVIEKELVLSKALANTEIIQRWSMNETDEWLKEIAVQEMKNFRNLFRSEAMFVCFEKTLNFYYFDKSVSDASISPMKTLSSDKPDDVWYFVTKNSPAPFSLNVDYGKEIEKTNLWINYVMKRDGKTLGIVGTGLDITKFVDAFVNTNEKGVSSFILNEDGAVFVSREKDLMNMGIVAKGSDERKKIFTLVPEKQVGRLQNILKDAVNYPEKVYILRTLFNNRQSVLSVSYIPSVKWIVLSAIDTSDVFETSDLLIPVVVVTAVAVLVFLVFSFIVDKIIVAPVKDLTVGAKELGKGNYSINFSENQKDEIGTLKSTFNKMTNQIQSNVRLLEEKVAERTGELTSSRDKISLLLNSAGEGFLLFDESFTVDEEYSKECVSIFGEDIAGKKIDALLFPEDRYRAGTFAQILKGTFSQDKKFLRSIMLDLLPANVTIKERHYRLRYQMNGRKTVILIMKDITEQIELTKKIEQEEVQLNFVIDFVKDELTVKGLIDDFRDLCTNGEGGINELYRRLHTFKGNFLQKGFISVPDAIHDEESAIQKEILRGGNQINVDYDKLKKALENDIEVLKTYLGPSVLETAYVKVPYDKLKALESRAANISSELYLELSQLTKIHLYEHLQGFSKTVERVAEREGKSVTFILECDENIRVGKEEYSGVINSLYHGITNAVIHGIELPEARVAAGKKETGTVAVNVVVSNNILSISITDDGKGVDLETLGIPLNKAESNDFSVLFQDGVSSAGNIDKNAGRGAGLAAIKSDAEKLSGRVIITSQRTKGTTISVKLPFKESY